MASATPLSSSRCKYASAIAPNVLRRLSKQACARRTETAGCNTRADLPKLRGRVVLDTAIRDAVRNTAPPFGYADSFDETSGTYTGLIWAKIPPELMPATAVLVRSDVALEQLQRQQPGTRLELGGRRNEGTGRRNEGASWRTGVPHRPHPTAPLLRLC